jgi:hypothetical protein
MSDPIEYLDERDDVEKTEYKRYRVDEGEVTVELWHDAEGLATIFKKAMDNVVSPRGLQDFAKEQALAVRETRVDSSVQYQDIEDFYPNIAEQLKEAADDNRDYEYERGI